MTETYYICRICHTRDAHPTYSAAEMMFGTGETFLYFECTSCGCLQIANIPDDLGRHYPAQYYSFSSEPSFAACTPQRIKAMQDFLKTKKIRRAFRKWPWLSKLGVTQDSRILDVGCGAGALLLALSSYGFRRLHGVDPYIPATRSYANGVCVEKGDLATISGCYDVIMLHHAFEHMSDQQRILQEIKRLLAPNGVVLLRIPIASSEAWRRFGTQWVQLDAPRHLYLHTVKSLTLLANSHDMKVEDVIYDSTAFQFTGSMLYQRGIALVDEKRHRPLFYRLRRAYYTFLAKRLNAHACGDQACFLLRPITP